MPSIPTRVHGVLDYAAGTLLVAAPWLLGFGRGGPETWVPVGVGAMLLLLALFTDYERGVFRRVQMTVHLWIDALAGTLLAASPWLLGFDRHVWLPHLAFGVAAIVVAAVSNTIPSYERRRTR